ncbi:MAG: prepilin-type N-terminal cleavage/methylation domain-containing protein, partial [Phycisphaerae bacterium]|nr:prepilin-type N-terminal cleavage/methylation domain-containing protein [Phycisphaerae bacterium]MDW8263535.1 prepilin-type N-terminal cleavage/methylation domain-containing protein [Phycisphaerales bacterium]
MRSRPGFTLAESMIAVVIVGMVAAALAGVLAAAYQQQAFAREQSAMLQAARALLEEIAALPFTEPDGSNGGGFLDGNMDRATYNDLFDFDGYSDLSPFRGLGSATSGQGGGG